MYTPTSLSRLFPRIHFVLKKAVVYIDFFFKKKNHHDIVSVSYTHLTLPTNREV